MIRGIAPIYARKLIRAFGEAVFGIIEQKPGRAREVTGIGAKRAESIVGPNVTSITPLRRERGRGSLAGSDTISTGSIDTLSRPRPAPAPAPSRAAI